MEKYHPWKYTQHGVEGGLHTVDIGPLTIEIKPPGRFARSNRYPWYIYANEGEGGNGYIGVVYGEAGDLEEAKRRVIYAAKEYAYSILDAL